MERNAAELFSEIIYGSKDFIKYEELERKGHTYETWTVDGEDDASAMFARIVNDAVVGALR